MDIRLVYEAVLTVFSNVDSLKDAVWSEDHVAINIRVAEHTATVRSYFPRVFVKLRAKQHITQEELNEELNLGPLMTSTRAHEYDADSYYSTRERLQIDCIQAEDFNFFKSIFEDYSKYVLAQANTLLPVYLALFRIDVAGVLGSKSHYYTAHRSLFPRQGHQHIYFLDLKGSSRSAAEGEFLKENDLTYEHEISFDSADYDALMRDLRSDVDFLTAHNIINYSMIIAITMREVKENNKLPGMPYGPDANEDELDDRKKTLPIRHDIRDGAKAINMHLLPKPTFVGDHEEWEYYYGISDIFYEFRTKSKMARAFKIAMGASGSDISTMPPADYSERFVSFLENKVFLQPF